MFFRWSILSGLCLIEITASTLAADLLQPGEFITLSPFVVEAGYNNSQFESPGLDGMAAGIPFEMQGTLAGQLDWTLGVSMQSRGRHSLEPNIQGMGFDRVVSTLNGIYLPNASPTHTGSPLNFFGTTGQLAVNVVRSLPSVVQGPVPTGSRILVESTEYESSNLTGRMSIDDDHGQTATLTARSRQGHNPLSLGIHYQEDGDYEGGQSGAVVDADYRAWGIQFNGMLFVGERNASTITANYFKQELSRNASLPLDTKDTPSMALTLNHSIELEEGILTLRGGYTLTEPFLTSEDRAIVPEAPLALVESKGEAKSSTIGADWKTAGSALFEIQAGMDCTWQERSMLRSRYLKNGTILNDLIWPDIEYFQAGAFAEVRSPGDGAVNWRLGARLDKVSSRINSPDSPVMGVPGARGPTIRENFIAFHGPAAARVKGQDWTGSANGIMDIVLSDSFGLHAGIGYTVASAGLGERYRSFVNALGGGVELGNPILKRERKQEVHAGASWNRKPVQISATAFYMEIDDFVGREIVSESPLVFSFENKDARFFGTHAAMEIVLLEKIQKNDTRGDSLSRLVLPFTISITRGEDARSGVRLPEVPPLEASSGVRYFNDSVSFLDSCVLTLMCRYVASQDNPQPDLNPIFSDTEAYTLVDLDMAFKWSGSWTMNFRIANLFDKEAYAYLQPPVATGLIGPSSGNLSGGDRIPLPGRSFLLTLGFVF